MAAAAAAAVATDGGVILACKLLSCVSGEPTLTIPGELTDMLAGDMATVCREDIDGGKMDDVAMGVMPSGISGSL